MATVAGQMMRRSTTYRRRMSNHLAAGLVVFSMLQIFIVASMGGSLIGHLGIIALLAVCVSIARKRERFWENLTDADMDNPRIAARFRDDVWGIWLGAIFLPFIWIPLSAI